MYCTYFLFHVSWLIYGNVMVWSDMGAFCRNDVHSYHVGNLVTVLICLGYLWFIIFTIVSTSYALFIFNPEGAMRGCSKRRLTHMKREALVGCFAKTRIHQVKYRLGSKCAICDIKFEAEDKCVEATC